MKRLIVHHFTVKFYTDNWLGIALVEMLEIHLDQRNELKALISDLTSTHIGNIYTSCWQLIQNVAHSVYAYLFTI